MINKLMYKIGGNISTFIEGVFAPLHIIPYAISALVRDKREVRKTYSKLFYKEVFNVGVKALPLSLVMGLSIGALSVILFPFETISFGIDNIYGSMYVNLLFRELAPLITSLIVIIRSSIGITIELTQMNIDGEVDTLEIIGINPIQYLGSFRVFAGFLTVPILTIYFAFFSLLSGMLVTYSLYSIPMNVYITEALDVMSLKDFIILLIKTIFGGFTIFVIAIYNGLTATKDRSMVASKTISSIITSIFIIVIFNLLITVNFYASK